jgi:hypothetical protein
MPSLLVLNLPPRTPIDPPPFVFNWVDNPLAPAPAAISTSSSPPTTSTTPSASDLKLTNEDGEDSDDDGEMIPATVSVLKEVEDDDDIDDDVIEHAVSNDAQSSLFWSTWFDSEEQEVKNNFFIDFFRLNQSWVFFI